MSDLDEIYSALMTAKEANDALGTWATNWHGREHVQQNESVIERGIKAYRRLASELRDGRKHIEHPDDCVPTGCECGVPGASPPCSYCTNYSEEDET